MKNFFTISAVLILLLSSAPAFAQESIDLATFSGRYGLPQSYDSVFSGKATEITSMINLKMPVVFNDKNIWYNDLTYNYFAVNNDITMPDHIANPIRLHGFILQTGLVHRFSTSTALQLLFAPRYMTDFRGSGLSRWQFGGIILYEKIFRDNLMMRFGALYNQELGGPFLVPLVYLDWRLSSRWSISGLLPIYAKVKYEVNEHFTTGLAFFGLITSYKLGAPGYAGDYMERTSIDPALFGRLRIAGNLFFEGRMGYAISRQYEQYKDDETVPFRISIISFGDDRVPVNVTFRSGMFFNARLVYNMSLTKDEK
jgi:hypothetical protein